MIAIFRQTIETVSAVTLSCVQYVQAAEHPKHRENQRGHQLQQQLRILAIRLLLPHPLRADLGGTSDPQIKLQLRQQPFKPARMPTGFH